MDPGELPDEELTDLATSMVRRWSTYDGRAVMFANGHEAYLHLCTTPLGNPAVVPEPSGPSWNRQLIDNWKINPDDLPEVFDQLNRGQSAEVVSTDGRVLRLWVNPKTGSRGVEPAVQKPAEPGRKRNYRKIAMDVVEEFVPPTISEQEREKLVGCVAQQLEQFQGHACLFLGERGQVLCRLTEHADGTANMGGELRATNLEATLFSLGFPPNAVPEAIARLNLFQQVEFQDKKGTPTLLVVDPRTGNLGTRPLQLRPQAAPPVFCPKCTAVLKPWRQGDHQQTCPQCGLAISLP